jgi:hypothetical protein
MFEGVSSLLAFEGADLTYVASFIASATTFDVLISFLILRVVLVYP